jgi:outer membrane protein
MSRRISRLDAARRTQGTAIAVCVAAAVSAAIPPSTARAETLIQAMVRAYQVNPTLKAQRASLRATDEQAAQAMSNWRPNLSISADAGRAVSNTKLNNFRRRINSARNPAGVGITLSQNVFRGGRNFYIYRQARYNILAARARLDNVEQQVLLSVVTAYMNVVRDQAVLRLNINNENVLRRQLQATRDRFSVGEVTRTDVSQAEARLAQARADRIGAEGTLRASQANYVNIVGAFPKRIRQPVVRVRLPRGATTIVAAARKANPTVVAAYYDELSAREQVRNVAGELLPSLNLNATAGRDFDATSRHSITDSATVTATVTIPLYQSGAVTSRLRAAKQTVFQRRNDLIQAQRTAVETATSALATLESARSQVTAFHSQVKANSIALEGVRQEAQAGLRTVLDVLNAQQELLTSQVNLVRAQRDLVVATYSLLSAVGRLTARRLHLPVRTYDATAHYKKVKNKVWGLGPSVGARPRLRP